MKNIFLTFALSIGVAVSALATGTYSQNPASLGPNPQQTGVINITNSVPGLYTNTVTFPYSYSSVPVMSLFQSGTNAANTPLTNSITTTNFTIVSVATNEQVAWTANLGYPRIEAGILGLGSFVSGSVTYTNTYSPSFAATPVLSFEGSAPLAATNSGIWVLSDTPTNFVIQTGQTNQIIYWGAFGVSAAQGLNTVTY